MNCRSRPRVSRVFRLVEGVFVPWLGLVCVGGELGELGRRVCGTNSAQSFLRAGGATLKDALNFSTSTTPSPFILPPSQAWHPATTTCTLDAAIDTATRRPPRAHPPRNQPSRSMTSVSRPGSGGLSEMEWGVRQSCAIHSTQPFISTADSNSFDGRWSMVAGLAMATADHTTTTQQSHAGSERFRQPVSLG